MGKRSRREATRFKLGFLPLGIGSVILNLNLNFCTLFDHAAILTVRICIHTGVIMHFHHLAGCRMRVVALVAACLALIPVLLTNFVPLLSNLTSLPMPPVRCWFPLVTPG